MKVCMYVCMSGGLPPDPHKPSPQNLAWAPHFTQARHQARGQPKMLPPGPAPNPPPALPLAPPTFAPEFLRSFCTGLFHNCIVK